MLTNDLVLIFCDQKARVLMRNFLYCAKQSCGGFTETKKVCDYADIFDVRIQAHVCGGPVATAAALHLETAIPNFLIHEHHTYAIKKWNRELCLQDPQPKNGFFGLTY